MVGIYDNEMKLEFVSKSSNEAFARITVAAFASQLDPTIEELADIKTAVSEAVTNSIIHGYENSEGIIKVECKLKDNCVEIQISDSQRIQHLGDEGRPNGTLARGATEDGLDCGGVRIPLERFRLDGQARENRPAPGSRGDLRGKCEQLA